MKRLVPAAALALVVGTTQPGCICTAAGALVGLVAGAVCDDPFPDTNDRIRKHVVDGAVIGLQFDLALLQSMAEDDDESRDARDDGTAFALIDVARAGTGTKADPSTKAATGPAGRTVTCSF
ncbi:MAG: hypothetical protein ACYTKD_17540 [Planctomycetota bacterium]|jgi:hypothetical protein